MKHYRSDLAEIFFSVLIPLLVMLVVAVIICCAPSIDEVLRGY